MNNIPEESNVEIRKKFLEKLFDTEPRFKATYIYLQDDFQRIRVEKLYLYIQDHIRPCLYNEHFRNTAITYLQIYKFEFSPQEQDIIDSLHIRGDPLTDITLLLFIQDIVLERIRQYRYTDIPEVKTE